MRRIWMAAAIGLALAGPAFAQQLSTALPATPVLIVDSDRLYQESRYGQQIRDGLDADAAALKAENDRIVAALTEEEQSLTLRRPGMTAEAFQAEAKAFDVKVQGIRRARDAKEVALQQARIDARDQFFSAVRDVVGQLMLERGATLILDRRSVFLALSAADVTDVAIARIDAALLDPAAPSEAPATPLVEGPPPTEPVPVAPPEATPDPLNP